MPYNVSQPVHALPDTMRAVVQREYGGLDRLTHESVPVPAPRPGEVLVRVAAAAVDHGTLMILEGRPWLARPAFGVRRPRHLVPGLDVSGTIEAVGDEVTGFSVGDRVVGLSRGALAELATVPAAKLASAPTSIELTDAASLPVSGITAVQTVRAASPQPGTSVLVIGASGGVGHYVVQLAVAAGASVTGVCSEAKASFVRSLGATETIAHDGDVDLFATGRTWDVVIDVMGNTPLRRLRDVTARSGRILLVGGDTGGRITAGYGRQMRALVAGPVLRRRIAVIASRERAADLDELVRRVDAGDVRPHVDRHVPLDRAEDALRHLGDGHVRGKVVVTM